MLNFFRAQMFRLFKSKSFYWISLALVLMLVGMTLIQNNLFTTGEASAEGAGIEIYVATDALDWLTDDLQVNLTRYGADSVDSQFNSLFIAIFAAMFFAAPYRHGYIKNYLGQWPNRAPLVLTDLIVLCLSVLWFAVLSFVTSFAAGYLIFGADRCFIGELSGQNLQALGATLLLNLAFGSLVYFIVTLSRSMPGALTGGLVLSLGASTIATLLDAIAHIFVKDFTLSDYTICGNLSSFYISSSAAEISRVAIVGAVALVIFASLSVLAMQKRDLN